MALDPSIILQAGHGVTPLEMPMDIAAKGMAMRNMMQTGQLQALQIQQGQQAQQDNADFRAQYGMSPGVAKAAKDIQLADLQAQKAKHDAIKASIDEHQAWNGQVAQILQGVRDQPTWDAARAQIATLAQQHGQDTSQSKDPQVYDPAYVQGMIKQNMSIDQNLKAAGQKLEADKAAWEQDFKGKTLAETTRHNKAMEAKPNAFMLMGGPGSNDPQAAQNYATRLVQGLEPWPSTISIRTDPTIRQGIELARQMDPGFNASTHAQREKTYKAFTTGPEAQTLNKIGTALTHLSEYSDTLEQVPDTGIGPLNTVINKARGAVGNVPINKANTIQTTLANELEGAYRAGGGTEAGIEHMRELLNPNLPMEARRANLAVVTQLLQGKQAEMTAQYNRGMGKFAAPLQTLSPEAQAAQTKVLNRGGIATHAAAPTGPVKIASDADYNALPSGAEFIAPDGSHRRKP